MIFNVDNIDDTPILGTLKSFARLLNNLFETKQLKFKKVFPDVKSPVKAHATDMCFDIYAYSDPIITDTYIQYETGLIFEIPEKYDMVLYPRSSISNYDLVLANSVGIVDQAYRNTILYRFKVTKQDNPKIYQKGDKIGQATLILKTNYTLIEVDEIDTNTDRGLGGFGSSGK